MMKTKNIYLYMKCLQSINIRTILLLSDSCEIRIMCVISNLYENSTSVFITII